MIEWHRVTWYSQIAAIVIGVALFGFGFWLGTNYGGLFNDEASEVHPVGTTSVNPEAGTPSSNPTSPGSGPVTSPNYQL